jgi:hypothetical protein
VFGSRWDCQPCLERKRRQSYVCFRRGGNPDEALRRLATARQHPNLLAMYDYAGVCPKTMLQVVPAEFCEAIGWYDKGGLGIPFHKVPAWFKQAMTIFEGARAQAQEQRAAEPRGK